MGYCGAPQILPQKKKKKKNFKYFNINKQREASISFKHLQINTWFLTFFWTPYCQSAGTDLNKKRKKNKNQKVVAW